MAKMTGGLSARLRSRLEAHRRLRLPAEGLRRAAVALVVIEAEQEEASVVLTRRAAGLRNHGGQFALPGGRLDPGETAIEAALRELHEEVGLERAASDVLGLLDDHVTRSGFHLTPVVVWGGSGQLTPSPDEVAAVYRVPCAEIADPATRRLLDFDGDGRRSLALAIAGTLVFAPTAALMLQLGLLAEGDVIERVDHHEQPRFAWR
ncbi:MAG: CoA pyrophosphatase [Acidobacteriota bacterium]